MRQYEVLVSNLGSVYTGSDGLQAITTYNVYARRSERSAGRGRCAGEPVTLLLDNHIWYEYTPYTRATAQEL